MKKQLRAGLWWQVFVIYIEDYKFKLQYHHCNKIILMNNNNIYILEKSIPSQKALEQVE